jgi:hypothetical protein
MPYLSGNATYDASLFAAESTKQTLLASATTQALATTADTAYLHTMLTAAQKNNAVQPGLALEALYELGLRS